MTHEEEPIANIDIGTGPAPIEDQPQPTRRSQRTWKPTLRTLESLQQEHITLPIALDVGNSLCIIGDETDDMADPIAFAAKSGKDTLYYHQAMRAQDLRQFEEAMQEEIDDHTKYKHWKIIPRSKVPQGHKVIDSV